MIKNLSRRLLVVAALVGAIGLMTTDAFAAEEEEGGDLRGKIRQQMEKIRKLMAENENALLELSTGAKAEPKQVDVDVPPPEGTNSGGANDGASGGEQGASGEKARKAIEELLRKQSESGEPIPEEITRLVKMIPL